MKKYLIALFVILLTACSLRTNSNLKYFPDHILNIMPGPRDKIYHGEEADRNITKRVDDIAQDVVLFINETYDLNWKYNTPSVKISDELPEYVLGNFSNGVIFLRNEPVRTDIIVHELIHFLTETNTNSGYFFVETDIEGYVYGGYIHEAITEYITEEYMASRYEVNKMFLREEFDYWAIVTCLESIEIASPGFVRAFLHGGTEEARNMMDSIAKEYVKNPSKVFFDLWLSLIDDIQVKLTEEGKYPIDSFLASVELVKLICPEEKQEKELKLFKDMFFMMKEHIKADNLDELIQVIEKDIKKKY